MAYYQQLCDSYFVESHDNHEKQHRDEIRERERYTKRQTQIAIGENLSQQDSYNYGDDILAHNEFMETMTLPDVAAIDIQTEIQWFMRPYLLDFLVEAHSAFALLQETLFLTINLLDRYCSRRVVYKKHYQLVGCCALLVASKYEDRKDRVPTIKELKAMCCGLYEDDMFTQMEWHVLTTVDWIIGHPTIDSFLVFALEKLPYDPEVEHMAGYISEIAMFYKEFVSKRPSDIARSSLAIARYVLNRSQALAEDWASRYDKKTLVSLTEYLHRPSSIVSRKYSSAHLSRVSVILDNFLARQAAISRCYAAPPTPPAETSSEEFGQLRKCNISVTPTKPHFLPRIDNGCLTPPITPTNQDCYAGSNATTGNFGRPPTPASLTSHPSNQQYGINCLLPPASQIAPMF